MIGSQSKRITSALAIALGTTMAIATATLAGPVGESGDAADSSPSTAPAPSPGNAANSVSNPAASSPDPVVELEQLRANVEAESQRLAEQTQELDSERAVLRDQLQRIASLESTLPVAPRDGAMTESALSQHIPVNASPSDDSPDSQTTSRPINLVSPDHPLSVKLGDAYFTPGGFVDLTGVFRSVDSGTGLGTNFSTLPYNDTLPLGQLSEFRFTGQGSRLSLKVEANPTRTLGVTGYIESDFNGYEPANSNVSTKSDTFRLRLAFLQLSHNKWDLVTGQTWTLLTPTREGLSPFPENVFTALRLDTSYLAGLVYDRQPSLRVVYHPKNWVSLAVALENPQQFVPSSVVFPTDGVTNLFASQFDNGSSNTSTASAGSNPTVPNLHPDVVAKTAFDWSLSGKPLHVEVAGLARSFKVYNNLVTPAGTNTITGGGGQFNVNFEAIKSLHLIENAFYGDGVGRYIGGLGPDVIVGPDGSVSAVHAGSAMAGAEWQATPKLLLDSYASGAYFWRNYAVTTKALGAPCGSLYCVGFGFPGSANTNNRDYQEATIGIIPTIWSSPNYGKLQLISQFSYFVRTPWYVAPGTPKNAHAFITYIDLRYIIP
jgi:hypothetical protein